MVKRKNMLRTFIGIVIGLCSLFSVTACRPNKEEEVEFQVDYNKMTYRYVEGHYCAGALSDGVVNHFVEMQIEGIPVEQLGFSSFGIAGNIYDEDILRLYTPGSIKKFAVDMWGVLLRISKYFIVERQETSRISVTISNFIIIKFTFLLSAQRIFKPFGQLKTKACIRQTYPIG